VLGKLAKILGFVGGVAAVAWAMRDRFISVAASREPTPPQFRGMQRNVELIEGIGPVFASRLSEAGLGSLSALAAADPATVATAAAVSMNRASTWVSRAGDLL